MTTCVKTGAALHAELDRLLDEPLADARQREQCSFQDALRPTSGRIVIYGAGNLGRKILSGLRDAHLDVAGFSDRNAALWSGKVDGLPVYSPEAAAAEFGEHALFIAALCHPTRTGGVQAVMENLRVHDCRHVISFVPLFWSDPARYLPHYMWDLPSRALEAQNRIRTAFDLFEHDPASQVRFLQQLRLRIHADFACLEPTPDHDQYFPDHFRPRPDESFVDCGAFNGDSIRDFLSWSGGSFRRIVAFEPDPKNAADLRTFIEADPRLAGRVEVKNRAVADRLETRGFDASGQGSASLSANGNIQVNCTTLDVEFNTHPVTFVKMDIEGFELAALEGGRNVISRDRPILAVCAYHLQNHLWEIPLAMSSVMARSRLVMVSHRMDGFDTVCYAIPDERFAAL